MVRRSVLGFGSNAPRSVPSVGTRRVLDARVCGRRVAPQRRAPRRGFSSAVPVSAASNELVDPSAFHHASEHSRARASSAAPPPPPPSKPEGAYGAEEITVLEGLEPVRKRPGMYIGSTGSKGLHHLAFEIVDNCIDEALAGHCDEVHVTLHSDGSVSVLDNGRGIPTATHAKTGSSALETVLSVLHAGGKFGDGGYKVSGGLHGVGLSVVNALSERLDATVWRDGFRHNVTYERGVRQSGLSRAADGDHASGTCIHFRPDRSIFVTTSEFDLDLLALRLRELSFLTAGLKVVIVDERGERPETRTYQHDGGIKEYLSLMVKEKTPLHAEPIYFSVQGDDTQLEVAMQWCGDSYTENIVGFVNNIRTIDGGTHLDGFKFALSKSLNAAAKAANRLRANVSSLSGEFVREGVSAIVSAKVSNPEFEGQTKTRLGNPEVREFVRTRTDEELSEFFALHPKLLGDVVDKAMHAHNAAQAARAARDLVRRKTVLETSTLPGKLADCASRDARESEIFIVEGNSAGGSAKQARNRHNQAVLPLRGKILNVEKSDDAKLYANAEVQALIQALGLGFKGEEFDLSKLRYHRVIIMTDADVDGSHIRALLLTMLYRYRRELVAHGLVYIACPPLYRAQLSARDVRYLRSESDLEELQRKRPGRELQVQRFKGLGEMMARELWETTMNPETRTLKQVTVEDAIAAEAIFSLLMGDNVAERKEFIQSNSRSVELEALDY